RAAADAVPTAKASGRCASAGAAPAGAARGEAAVRAEAARAAARARATGRPGAGARPAGGGGRPRKQDNVEKPRTDETATSAEGREQPVVEPQVETTPAPAADAPDTTTPKVQDENPAKLEKADD